jgi:hypothetical protein
MIEKNLFNIIYDLYLNSRLEYYPLWSKFQLQEILNYNCYYLHYIDNKLIGFIASKYENNIAFDTKLYIATEYQRCGLSRLFVRKIEKIHKELAIKKHIFEAPQELVKFYNVFKYQTYCKTIYNDKVFYKMYKNYD